MLVLSRRQNESVLIQEDIVVEVLEIRGNRVRLGIRAPEYVRVVRAEISHNNRKSGDDVSTNARDRADWGSTETPTMTSEFRMSHEVEGCRPGLGEPSNRAERANDVGSARGGAQTIRETLPAHGKRELAHRTFA